MKFALYLIFRGAYIREGLIFGKKFVLVIRGAYIRGGLCSGFYGMYCCGYFRLLSPSRFKQTETGIVEYSVRYTI